MTKDMCEVTYVHEDKVNRAKKDLAKQDPMDVARVFKALSGNTRIKITYILSLEGEPCTCNIANIIRPSTTTAPHHLRLLKNLGMAEYRKEGKVVHCSPDNEHVKQFIEKPFLYQRKVVSAG